MNYLKQIVAFDKWEELHPLSDKAYRLWFKLMAIANTSGWDEWLSVPLLKLKSELHTSSDQTIMNARNALVQAGRIEVRKGKHGKSADYRLVPFPEKTSGALSRDNSGVKSGEDSGGLGGVKSGEDSGTYYKQNKTKQNKSIVCGTTSDLSPIFDLWQSNWGFPNSIAQQDLTDWVHEFGIELVKYAIERALKRNVNAKGADGYLDRIFQAYRQKGIKTVEDAVAETKQYQQQFSRERTNNGGHQHIEEPLPDWAGKEYKRPSKEFFDSLYDE